MKWIKSSVNILCSISATLGDGAGVVRPREQIVATTAQSDADVRPSHTRNQSSLVFVFSSPSVTRPSFLCTF